MFNQLVLFTHSGHLEITLSKDAAVKITLNEQECSTLRDLCERFYADRQAALAAVVASPVPQLADFSEVEA